MKSEMTESDERVRLTCMQAMLYSHLASKDTVGDTETACHKRACNPCFIAGLKDWDPTLALCQCSVLACCKPCSVAMVSGSICSWCFGIGNIIRACKPGNSRNGFRKLLSYVLASHAL